MNVIVVCLMTRCHRYLHMCDSESSETRMVTIIVQLSIECRANQLASYSQLATNVAAYLSFFVVAVAAQRTVQSCLTTFHISHSKQGFVWGLSGKPLLRACLQATEL